MRTMPHQLPLLVLLKQSILCNIPIVTNVEIVCWGGRKVAHSTLK